MSKLRCWLMSGHADLDLAFGLALLLELLLLAVSVAAMLHNAKPCIAFCS